MTYVSSHAYQSPISLLLNMTHADTAATVKEKVVDILGLPATSLPKMSLVEVLDHHISRIIDDWLLLKHLKDDRQVCRTKLILQTSKSSK